MQAQPSTTLPFAGISHLVRTPLVLYDAMSERWFRSTGVFNNLTVPFTVPLTGTFTMTQVLPPGQLPSLLTRICLTGAPVLPIGTVALHLDYNGINPLEDSLAPYTLLPTLTFIAPGNQDYDFFPSALGAVPMFLDMAGGGRMTIILNNTGIANQTVMVTLSMLQLIEIEAATAQKLLSLPF